MNELIKKRYSPRAFDEKVVSKEVLYQLFDAARWAPSARNEQPWRFIFATKANTVAYERMFLILNEWNQNWAQSAPVLIAAIAKLNYNHKNIANEHAVYDLGQAVSYLTLQATALDLYLHQMGGFYPEKAKTHLNLPEGYQVVTMIALGYKGSVNRIPEAYHADENAARTRNEINSFAFEGKWSE